LETPVPAAPTTTESGPSLSMLQRIAAIYFRPTAAWSGLRERVQWWFPMLLFAIVNAATIGAVYRRAFLPMISSQWEGKVESGEMTPEAYDQVVAMMSGPTGQMIFVVQQFIMTIVLLFGLALAVWFGVSFVLGHKMKYRWALEVASWSSLISIPTVLLTGLLAWVKEDWMSAHVGFGILLPQPDTPSRLMTALGVFLDGIGPLAIWYVTVLVIGASTMSGAPRKNTAWVIGGLYVLLLAFGAALASLQVPAS